VARILQFFRGLLKTSKLKVEGSRGVVDVKVLTLNGVVKGVRVGKN